MNLCVQQWMVVMTRMLDCMEQILTLLQLIIYDLNFEENDILELEELRSSFGEMRRLLGSLGYRFLSMSSIETETSAPESKPKNQEQYEMKNTDETGAKNEAIASSFNHCINSKVKIPLMKKTKVTRCVIEVDRKCLRKEHGGGVRENNLEVEDYPNDDNHPNIIKDAGGLDLPENGYGYELFYAMQRHRKKVAQIIEVTNETQTFEELLNISVNTAVKLEDKAVTQSDIICVCVSNSRYSSVTYLAGLFLGCTMTAIDISFNLEDICYFLRLVTPTVMFVDDVKVAVILDALQKVEGSIRLIVIGDDIEGLENIREYTSTIEDVSRFRPYKVKSMKENCAIFFSSGTSGYPKAICLSHNNLLHQITYTAINGNLNGVVLSYTSFYWISGVILLGYCILTGSARILPLPFDVSRFYTLVDQNKVQIAFLGPFECTKLVKSEKPPRDDTFSLKWIVAGGAVLKEEFIFSLRRILKPCKVIQSYGQTETTGPIFKWNVSSPEDLALCIAKPASTGKPCGGVWYKIIDENTTKILGPYQLGEICIKSDTLVMNGYYRKDSSDVFDGNGWLKTGDLGYYDDYHCFYIIDRIKELIKYRGWHVPPIVLENLLLKHPVVANAAVIGIPHLEDGEHPMGFIILKDGTDPDSVDTQEIVEFVNAQVDERKILRGGVKIIDALPMTATGKVNRKALRDSLILKDVK